MPVLFTASAIHDAFCKANGLDPKKSPSILNRIRYLAKRGLLLNGTVVDERGTFAFELLELFRAAIYTELAGLTMDIRAFAPIGGAAARRHTSGLHIPRSMKFEGGFRSRGGLWDSIHGVAQGEAWSLVIRLVRPGISSEGGLVAEFVCEDASISDDEMQEVDNIIGRDSVRTRVSVDLTALFEPLIKIVGVPE